MSGRWAGLGVDGRDGFLLAMGESQGLQHLITLAASGDLENPQLYPVQVVDGKFVAPQ